VALETAVIGEDTDSLVLLRHHAKLGSKPIHFKSDIKSSTSKRCIKIKILEERQ